MLLAASPLAIYPPATRRSIKCWVFDERTTRRISACTDTETVGRLGADLSSELPSLLNRKRRVLTAGVFFWLVQILAVQPIWLPKIKIASSLANFCPGHSSHSFRDSSGGEVLPATHGESLRMAHALCIYQQVLRSIGRLDFRGFRAGQSVSPKSRCR